MRGYSGGDMGAVPPIENHKNLGFLKTTCPDPLKNHKATEPAFNVGQSLADDGPILAVFGSTHQQKTKQNKKQKTFSKLDPTPKKLSGSAMVDAFYS